MLLLIISSQLISMLWAMFHSSSSRMRSRSNIHSRLLLTSLLMSSWSAMAQAPSTATLRGTIIDFKTKEPLAHVKVELRSLGREVITDDRGRFELTQLEPGVVEIAVSTVGYSLLGQKLTIPAGQTLDLELPLGPEAVKPSAVSALNAVTVTVKSTQSALPETPSLYAMNNTDLQNLSTVLANDPMRAMQTLPGVTANQDFYGQFAVRGAGPGHVGVVIDGVLLDNAFHGFTDKGDLGSVSIVNGSLVDSSSLFSGVAPARFGGRTGATVQVDTREGSRDDSFTRLDVDFLSASLTQEGPLGTEQRGSYIVSARKSYLDYLTSSLKVKSSTLGYSDLDVKLDYDLNPTNRVSLTTVFGTSQIAREANLQGNQSLGFLTDGSGQQDFTTLRWTSQVSPSTTSRAQFFWASDSQTQRNSAGDLLMGTDATQSGLSEELTHTLSDQQTLEAGWNVLQRQTSLKEQSIWNYNAGTLSTALVPVADFSKTAVESGVYLQDTAKMLEDKLKLKFGARWDYSSATGQSVFLPRVDASYALRPGTQVGAAIGQTAQFPSMDNLYGKFGTPGLNAERATTAALSFDQDLGDRWRLHTELYERNESQLIYSPLTQFRLTSNGSYAIPTTGPVLTNGLSGYARGVEIMLQRQSANGFSGWLAVSRSQNRYATDTGIEFSGDNEQRTSITAYGSYRWSNTLSFSAVARYGSGTPIPGYLGASSGASSRGDGPVVMYAMSPSLNTQQATDYQRLDLRVNKVIYGPKYKLTLKAEIANVLNHDNWRYYDYIYPTPGTAQTVAISRNTTMPRLPTIGLSLEF
ncbi:MAG: TonB-dependent receptor [Burkholderiales bacterium]|nr:TonB-dependent receptor [Burkholderiales bacterium]